MEEKSIIMLSVKMAIVAIYGHPASVNSRMIMYTIQETAEIHV